MQIVLKYLLEKFHTVKRCSAAPPYDVEEIRKYPLRPRWPNWLTLYSWIVAFLAQIRAEVDFFSFFPTIRPVIDTIYYSTEMN